MNKASWYTRRTDDSLEIRVLVQARSRQPGIQGIHDGRLKLRVAAAPADGAANREVIQSLAKAFGVAPSRVQLLRGASQHRKTLRVEAPDIPPEAILR